MPCKRTFQGEHRIEMRLPLVPCENATEAADGRVRAPDIQKVLEIYA